MKTKMYVSIMFILSAILILFGNCASTPEIQEESKGINQVTFLQAVAEGSTDKVKKKC
jgi:uncharacterized lipoprotein YajG